MKRYLSDTMYSRVRKSLFLRESWGKIMLPIVFNKINGAPFVRALMLALMGFTATLTVFAPTAFAADVLRVEGAPVLSTQAEPVVVWRSAPNARAAAVNFMPLPGAALQSLREENGQDSSNRIEAKAIKIGVNRNADTEVSNAGSFVLNWQNVSNGFAARLAITSPDASAMRVALQLRALPDGAELRFSGSGAPDKIIGVVSGKEANSLTDDDKVYWTPVTDGQTQNIEIFLPSSANTKDVNVRLNAVSHLFTSAREGFDTTLVLQASQACEVDVACKFATLGTAFQNTTKAVARMVFSDEKGTHGCTGTLLKDTSNSQTPYFWTAAHCISTQAAANTLNTYWNYEAASCGSVSLNSNYRSLSGGAQLLHTKVSNDTTLLRLNDTPPAGAWFAGWDATRFLSGAMIGIHHPLNDIKKVSTGNGEGATCASAIIDPSVAGSSLTLTSWSEGTTEDGSSGSGVFTLSNGNYYLRGGLMGGTSTCSSNALNISCYSSLNLVYDEVKQYLSPNGPVPDVTITASAGVGGSISPSGAVTVNSGATWSFTITPNTGYTIITPVGGTCGGTLNGNTFTTYPVSANCTVTAAFTQGPTPPTYIVTASAGTGGTINPSGAVAVSSGAIKTFTVTPNAGYVISSVGGTCRGSFNGNTYTTDAIYSNCTVTAAFVVNNPNPNPNPNPPPYYAVTSSAGYGGTISASGKNAAIPGSTVHFTITPNANYAISAVGGSCGGKLNGNIYTTNPIIADCTVIVEFVYQPNSNYYTVTASADVGGSITPSGAVRVNRGAISVFTITPNANYAILSVDGTCIGTLNGTTYTTYPVNANCTVRATFVYRPGPSSYTVTASAGPGGSISPSAVSVNAGATQQFTIAPNAGYTISSASGCGGTLSGTIYTTGPITASCTVTAAFAQGPATTHTLTVSAGVGGTITPSGTGRVPDGTAKAFTIAPNAGYAIITPVGGTCGGTLNGTTYTTYPITADCTVTVAFVAVGQGTRTVTASAGAGGSITPLGAVSVNAGATQQFTIAPNAGYTIITPVGGTCRGTLSGNTYTISPVTDDCTVTAAFTPKIYVVTASAGAGGTISQPGGVAVQGGSTKAFTITPNAGYAIITPVGGTCGGTLSGNTYTTGPITANCTVTAAFVAQ